MAGFFHNIGRRLGRATVPAMRKSKWIWAGLTGNEEEALQAEVAFGRVLAVELRNATEPLNDPPATELLNEVCQRLTACVRDQRRNFRVELIFDETPSAMALPGGYIFMSHALLNFCGRQPDELAFIIGHEMGHILREHVWDRMLSQTASQAATAITARTGPLGTWLRHKGMGLLQSAFARDSETEADEFGLRLAASAHFDANGALALLRRLDEAATESPDLGQYFSSHPPAAQRIAALQPLCRRLTAEMKPPQAGNG